MKQLRYIEIENFKTFEGKIRIELGHPAVLIGPNNAGKTSVIQALALWNRGIKNLRRTLLRNLKMSKFTDQVFEEFAKSQNQPILLKKGEFHQLIEFMDIEDIPAEVTEKLDLIVKYLS